MIHLLAVEVNEGQFSGEAAVIVMDVYNHVHSMFVDRCHLYDGKLRVECLHDMGDGTVIVKLPCTTLTNVGSITVRKEVIVEQPVLHLPTRAERVNMKKLADDVRQAEYERKKRDRLETIQSNANFHVKQIKHRVEQAIRDGETKVVYQFRQAQHWMDDDEATYCAIADRLKPMETEGYRFQAYNDEQWLLIEIDWLVPHYENPVEPTVLTIGDVRTRLEIMLDAPDNASTRQDIADLLREMPNAA